MKRAFSTPLRTGVVALSALALLLYMAYARSLPFPSSPDGDLVRAEFGATNELRAGDPVRVRGVEVGHVEDVRLSPSGRSSSVELRITDSDVIVKRDASAHVRWRLILGGSLYVDLAPGSSAAPPLGDRPIDRARTSTQVEFDDLTQPFAGGTAKASQRIIRGFNRGFLDPSAGRTAVEALSPTLRTVQRGVDPLQGRSSHDLRRLVSSTALTVQALSRDGRDLSGLVTGGRRTLDVTAGGRRPLGELIELSPRALDSTRSTLRRVDATLVRLDPLAARLRPGARALAPAARAATPALEEADPLLRTARPLLRELGPTLERLRDASRTGAPLIEALDPTLRRFDRTLLPFLARRDPDTRLRNYEAIGPTAAAVGDAASEFDAEGYWLHFPAPGDERTVGSSPCQTFFTDPSAPEQIRCRDIVELLQDIFSPPTRSRR